MASNTTTNGSLMRKDYLGKDDYYMGIAVLSSHRSKAPNTQVGACIVNEDDRIVGIGYKGMPNGTKDEQMPWGKDGESEFVCHAVMNAIANKYAADLKNCRIYVSYYPCNECAKLIVQAGITKVIYGNPLPPEDADKPKYKATKEIFEYTKVTFRQHKPKKITINLEETASALKEENK